MRRHHTILAVALLVQGCAAGTSPLAGLGSDRIAVSEASFDMSSVASTRLPRDRNQAMQQVLSGLVPMAEPAAPDTATERARSTAPRGIPAPLQALVAAAPTPVVRAAPAGRVVSQPLPPAPRAAATTGSVDGIDVGLSPAMRRI